MENMQNMGGGMKNMCKCPHHKVVPVLIILFGLTFLLQALGVVTAGFSAIVWPILVIIGGFMKWANKAGMCKCC